MKKRPVDQAVFLRFRAELSKGVIRFHPQIDADKPLEGVAIIDGILQPDIRQVEPDLKQVHPEHNLYSPRWAAAFPGGIIRLNLTDPLNPWNDLVHQSEKLLLLCYLLPSAVFHGTEGHLIHALNPLILLAPWHFYYTTYGGELTGNYRLNQRFPKIENYLCRNINPLKRF